jgi:hypothetical protein
MEYYYNYINKLSTNIHKMNTNDCILDTIDMSDWMFLSLSCPIDDLTELSIDEPILLACPIDDLTELSIDEPILLACPIDDLTELSIDEPILLTPSICNTTTVIPTVQELHDNQELHVRTGELFTINPLIKECKNISKCPNIRGYIFKLPEAGAGIECMCRIIT